MHEKTDTWKIIRMQDMMTDEQSLSVPLLLEDPVVPDSRAHRLLPVSSCQSKGQKYKLLVSVVTSAVTSAAKGRILQDSWGVWVKLEVRQWIWVKISILLMILPASQAFLVAPAAETYFITVITQRKTNHHHILTVLHEQQLCLSC